MDHDHFDEVEDGIISISDEELQKLVEIVKNRILEHDKFPLPPRTDAPFITKFIRGKKYNPDTAFNAIVKYYDNIKFNLRVIEGIKPEQYIDTYKLDAVKILKNRFRGSVVAHISVKNWDTKVASLRDVEAAGSFVIEELMDDQLFQQHGVIAIIDTSGLAFSHVKQCTFHEIRRILKLGLDAYPVRVVGVHFVNTPMMFWPLYKIAMKCLPTKLQSRVHVHNDTRTITSFLPPEILPQRLGGILEEDEAWDMELFTNLLNKNPCYDSYWNGSTAAHRPRRMSRKRSSMMMTS